MGFIAIARLATDDDVSLYGLTIAADGDDVVHGEVLFFKLLTAVVTEAFLKLLVPPGGFTKVPGFLALSFNVGRIGRAIKQFHQRGFVTQFPLWMELIFFIKPSKN